MRIANKVRVRRSLQLAAFLALGCSSALARADGEAWIAPGSFAPIEAKVAIASGPSRTTTWTSLRFDGPAGPVGLVLPVPPGASLDIASDAWMEALEVATAPRIFPPKDESSVCPGATPTNGAFAVAGDFGHTTSLAPVAIVLPDAPSVLSWATDNGLAVDAELALALGALGSSVRFLAVRVDAPGGPALTPTMRVVAPSAAPVLPLALTRAGHADLRVTSFFLGAGRAELVGAQDVLVPSSKIVWNAATATTTYEHERAKILAAHPLLGDVLESASHRSLGEERPIADGTATIASVLAVYFERAAAYGDGSQDVGPCLARAAATLVSSQVVATACPRAALGVVDGSATCVDGSDGAPADHLRCGVGADDLAVALSGLAPSSVWLTRRALAIPATDTGLGFPVAFASGAEVSPVLQASAVDASTCEGSSTSSSSSSGSGSSSGGPSSSSSSGGEGDGEGTDLSSVDLNVDVSDNTSCSCGGTQGTSDGSDSGSSSDSCSGSGSSDGNSDSCGGGSSGSSSDSCSGSGSGSSGDSCGGGSSGGDSCSGGGSGSGCSGGGGGSDCSIGGSKRRAPRASILLFVALAIAAPLRRRGRRSRARRTLKGAA